MSIKIILKKVASNKIVVEAKKLAAAWSSSEAGTFGASVAYYTIFSIAPLLVIAISVAGIVVDKAFTQATIINQFSSTFGSSSGELIKSLIESKASESANILLTIIGFVVLLLGAVGIFSELQTALDAIFETLPDKNQKKNIWTIIRHKLLSLGMVVSVGFLLLSSLALSAFVTLFGHYLSHLMPGGNIIAHIVEFIISFGLISLFLSLLYKVLPSKRLRWKHALIGGFIAGTLFTISKSLLGMYLGSSTITTGYGGASALVLFVLWVYYISQVLFLSAMLTRLYVVPKMKFRE